MQPLSAESRPDKMLIVVDFEAPEAGPLPVRVCIAQ